MKRAVNIAAGVVNVIIIVAMAVVFGLNVQEARAEQRLSTISDADRVCLAQNIFFEARNQSVAGQVAVAWVTINRMESSRFPSTICDVVRQARLDANGNPIRHRCQFSWYCDGRSDRIPNNVIAQRAWADAQLIADVVLLDWARAKNTSPVQNATYYHAHYVSPSWAREFERVAVVDDHIFYAN
jgi:N-acetylmuramoyl-L-alanine amidase